MKRGFTLIEVLVAVGIMMVLTVGGVLNMKAFNDRQQVAAAAGKLESGLKQARANALAGEKTSGCVGVLDGWRVVTAGSGYTLEESCGGVNVDPVVESLGVTVTGADILYKPLGQGAVISTGTIQVAKGLVIKTIAVGTNGEVVVQ